MERLGPVGFDQEQTSPYDEPRQKKEAKVRRAEEKLVACYGLRSSEVNV